MNLTIQGMCDLAKYIANETGVAERKIFDAIREWVVTEIEDEARRYAAAGSLALPSTELKPNRPPAFR